ncbi:MAG TPA: prepilin-type N-terminal cleavage/methylation domain-containing protein [Methylomirabilota bacterium]|nr:prepilin-type N-terminal cleavage/methylation domain-containing protein [Methylomirabilota bacterium]
MCGKLQRNSCRAFTLSELAVGIAVSSIILTALLSFTVYGAKSFNAMSNYVDLEQKSQNALDTMTSEVRQTRYLSNYLTKTLNGVTITNTLTFVDFDSQLLVYTFTNDVLLRRKAGTETMLLTNVDYLNFGVFQRNTKTNSFDQFPTSDAPRCKVISVSWICSRTILGSKMNTESVQTAKIVIRKQ